MIVLDDCSRFDYPVRLHDVGTKGANNAVRNVQLSTQVRDATRIVMIPNWIIKDGIESFGDINCVPDNAGMLSVSRSNSFVRFTLRLASLLAVWLTRTLCDSYSVLVNLSFFR